MSAAVTLAVGAVRSWTATYTRGLPGEIRAERIEEIDSDLWDHARLAALRREPSAATAFEILTRAILGLPADLTWRIETGAEARRARRNSVNSTLVMRIGLLVATVALLVLVVNGIAIVMGAGEWDSRRDQVIWGLAFAAFPLLAVVGLWLSATMPKLGVGLVVAGVVLSSLAMFWMSFLLVPVGLAIVVLAMKRGGLSIWPMRRSEPGPA